MLKLTRLEKLKMNKQSGFNLVEMMVAMLLGIIVVGSVLSIFIATIESSSDTLKSARLNHDLSSVAQLMGNELRRAGYWGGAKVGEDTLVNPAMTGGANITIEDYAGTDDCILYTYDSDDGDNATDPDQPDGNINTNEYYGFRHNGDGIDMRLAINTVADVSCTDTDATWHNIIDTTKLKITELAFSFANSRCFNVTTSTNIDSTCSAAITAGTILAGDRAIETRQILITLAGEVLSDGDVTKNYTLDGVNDNRIQVKVRNNRVFVEP